MTNRSQIRAVSEWLGKTCPNGDLFSDSREIVSAGKDAVFFAYQGDATDGRSYIAHAIENGAKAIVYEEAGFDWKTEWHIPHLAVKGLKALAGPVADAYYGNPSASMYVVAVTGTNGKTSCTQWLGSALSRLGEKTAVIGTLGIVVFENGNAGKAEITGYTTPDQVQLQRKLAMLREEGVACVAIEASSIGIEECRLNGLVIDTVLYTNFTRDHLDYHKNMAAYEAAKRKLFDWPGLKHAVMNLDDAKGREWASAINGKLSVSGYTIQDEKMEGIPVLRATEIQARQNGTVFLADAREGHSRIQTRLVGNFNVSNVLGVLGVLLTHGVQWKPAVSAVSALEPPPGRMQPLGGQNAPLVVIDYAHTPDALEKGLQALRSVATDRKGALWCVFGCGGDRDRGKRKDMGRVSEMADHIIVTSDNPRSEVPQQIIDDIVSGMTRPALTIEDRASAILQAVKQASAHDVIFLAGKGHETYQEVKGAKHPFVDADHASLALATYEVMKKERHENES
ncbi:UDP-N-acetylmuramoyl-L-alanyl-D-glutamate--2,6-diaminopimelate ligase [Oxalobacter vibrioformis]|uniref:UDP-N-acetylmuramoyl-L-alanyl-D-glutamate--2,6-diaminopimelate ligase n=1 Tax=Oxalobacter vibrioformis TaxID=933080 RepID=A0A9E9P4I4_9BURK|nr:UDP-N-acetylmuramoyl-L-alanyl-D-glutamate--2,6-diaminopimelate ligase [Oxalobacter vibrioformis]WAW11128.1 UDP-N-acetylmuramoyl-L-alanyl-D-glutamate--2,6-diaminopimelate ligase [Oxalobacter vibrioformis]